MAAVFESGQYWHDKSERSQMGDLSGMYDELHQLKSESQQHLDMILSLQEQLVHAEQAILQCYRKEKELKQKIRNYTTT